LGSATKYITLITDTGGVGDIMLINENISVTYDRNFVLLLLLINLTQWILNSRPHP
jgi:hypothetical protein